MLFMALFFTENSIMKVRSPYLSFRSERGWLNLRIRRLYKAPDAPDIDALQQSQIASKSKRMASKI